MKELRLCEIRAATPQDDAETMRLHGMPVVYDTPTVIKDGAGGEFIEIIKRGALDNADMSDCRLTVNHDLQRVPLAKSGRTMKLSPCPAGLEMDCVLPDTSAGVEAYTAVKRGDISSMSFCFTVPAGGDNYDPYTNTRTIYKINKLYEVSLVTFPAYPQTSVEARSVQEAAKSDLVEKQNALKLINEILG